MVRQSDPPGSFSPLVFVAVGCITVAGLWLRLHALASKSLWLDEIWSLTVARMSGAGVLWSMVNQDPNASLYYLLLHYWIRLGESEFVIRSLSALAGAMSIPAVYLIGRRLAGRTTGVLSAALLALNLYHIQYSQEARSYSLMVFLTILSTLWFASCIERPTAANQVAYVWISSLAVYAHIFAVLVLAAQLASLLFLPAAKLRWKTLSLSNTAIGVLCIPLAWLIIERARHPFVNLAWVPRPSIRRVYDAFYALSGNASYYGLDVGKALGGRLLLLLYFVACLIALFAAVKQLQNAGRSISAWRNALLFSWLLVPIVLNVVMSTLGPSMFLTRYLLISAPPLAILAAKSIIALRRTSLRWALVLVIFVLHALGFAQYYRYRTQYQEWRSATAYIVHHSETADAAFFSMAHGRLLFEYYERSASIEKPPIDVLYPTLDHVATDPNALSYFPEISSDTLAALNSRQRIWLISYPDDMKPAQEASERIAKIAMQHYAEVDRKHIGQVIIVLYARSPELRGARSTPAVKSTALSPPHCNHRRAFPEQSHSQSALR